LPRASLPTPPRLARRVKPVRLPKSILANGAKPVDFMLGPYEFAESLREKRPCRLSAELAVHITELLEAIQHPDRCMPFQRLRTEFKPIAPLPELPKALLSSQGAKARPHIAELR
jgi:hypothetical protein